MRRRPAGAAMLLLLLVTGCPFEWGKDQWVDKQVHKSEVELIVPRCTREERRLYCDGDKAGSPECIEKCGK